MRLRAWIERRRVRRRARSADDLRAWLESSRALLAFCQGPLRLAQGPSDIGVVLDQIDRRLMGYRNEADVVRRLLRSHAALAVDTRRATDNVFRLRNETCAFLLRWRTQQLLPASHPAAINAQRHADTARLQASRTARDLTLELDRLAPEVDRLASDWIRAAIDRI